MGVLLLSTLIAPADTGTGRVIDNGGQPIPQATVEITELGKSVTATADGGFRLVLAPGRYTLAVRRPAFAPAVRAMSVGGPAGGLAGGPKRRARRQEGGAAAALGGSADAPAACIARMRSAVSST